PVSIEHPAAEDERRRDEQDRRRVDEDEVADRPASADAGGLDLGLLTDTERRVLELRHGIGDDDPHPIEAVARLLGLDPDEVRQIETDGIAKLQRHRATG
ncbi:MAG: hypothetical protein QOE27_1684, partial [Solirubrobacteraceae bacterium]|nr:hypothetical protein [Solirubrobacteraceae bacterium]